ncbi:MAG: hypothetical protein ACYDDF_12160 [Thermoplasmatota archaeon]
MFEVSPEMVLGKEVIQSDGSPLGPVVDVGVHDMRNVKFLLVEDRPRRYVRLTVDRIDRIDSSVVLKP